MVERVTKQLLNIPVKKILLFKCAFTESRFGALFLCISLKFKKITMKKVLIFAFALFVAGVASAQTTNPVKWSYEAKQVADGEYDLVFTAHVTDGWYIYSQFLESDEGPIPTSFNYDENNGVEIVGKTAEDGPKHEGYDDIFAMNLVKYSGKPTFTQRVKVMGETTLTGYLEFMTCDKRQCLPPSEVDFKFYLK